MSELNKEFADMLGDGEDVEEVVVEEPIEEEVVEEVEEVVEEEDSVEEVVEPVEPEPQDDLSVQLEAIRKEKAALEAKLTELSAQAPQEPEPEPLTVEEMDFLGERHIDNLLSDSQTFNAFINEVARKIIEGASANIGQNIMTSIPQIVRTNVTNQMSLARKVDDFYRENSDLADKKQFVGIVANELQAKNPEWTVEQLFSEAAAEARKRLGTASATPARPAAPQKKPALPGGTKVKGAPAKPLTGTMKEIDDMLKTVD